MHLYRTLFGISFIAPAIPPALALGPLPYGEDE